MEYFIHLLQRHSYIYSVVKQPGTDILAGFFLAHPNTKSMIRLFPQVVLMDATYKTNLYDMPLVEVIGILPTGQNYHIAFIFVSDEKTSSYVWGLTQLRVLFTECGVLPGVYRELVAMRAIEEVFPEAAHLLCRRHISKDVHKYVSNMMGVRKSMNVQ